MFFLAQKAGESSLHQVELVLHAGSNYQKIDPTKSNVIFLKSSEFPIQFYLFYVYFKEGKWLILHGG